MLKLLLIFILCSNIAFAHPGRQDSTGGHVNRKTNVYHCHKEPCISNQKESTGAVQEAKADKVEYSSLYNRKDWPHWVDLDRDCQDARAEVLITASSIQVKFKRNKGCSVSHGKWFDPYSNQTFTQASKLDVDHIIPLKEAHISGGSDWTREERRVFANDPENLLVVSAGENRSKGAKDPAQWMPDVISYHCEYVKLWVGVKTKYSLAIDSVEQVAINKILAGCKHQ